LTLKKTLRFFPRPSQLDQRRRFGGGVGKDIHGKLKSILGREEVMDARTVPVVASFKGLTT
jgi:hypothetical protein